MATQASEIDADDGGDTQPASPWMGNKRVRGNDDKQRSVTQTPSPVAESTMQQTPSPSMQALQQTPSPSMQALPQPPAGKRIGKGGVKRGREMVVSDDGAPMAVGAAGGRIRVEEDPDDAEASLVMMPPGTARGAPARQAYPDARGDTAARGVKGTGDAGGPGPAGGPGEAGGARKAVVGGGGGGGGGTGVGRAAAAEDEDAVAAPGDMTQEELLNDFLGRVLPPANELVWHLAGQPNMFKAMMNATVAMGSTMTVWIQSQPPLPDGTPGFSGIAIDDTSNNVLTTMRLPCDCVRLHVPYNENEVPITVKKADLVNSIRACKGYMQVVMFQTRRGDTVSVMQLDNAGPCSTSEIPLLTPDTVLEHRTMGKQSYKYGLSLPAQVWSENIKNMGLGGDKGAGSKTCTIQLLEHREFEELHYLRMSTTSSDGGKRSTVLPVPLAPRLDGEGGGGAGEGAVAGAADGAAEEDVATLAADDQLAYDNQPRDVNAYTYMPLHSRTLADYEVLFSGNFGLDILRQITQNISEETVKVFLVGKTGQKVLNHAMTIEFELRQNGAYAYARMIIVGNADPDEEAA